MNKSLYIFANLFLGLSVATGLLQSLIRFQLGAQIFALESFAHWFLVINIISFIGSFIMLKYYHYRKYWFPFSAGILVTLANLSLFIIIYILLVTRESPSYYIPTLLFTLGAGIVYAISLIFSQAGERPWLKRAGVFLLIIGLVSMSAIIWALHSPAIQTNGTLEKISQWLTLASSLAPVLLIMNFLSELKLLKAENPHIPMRKSLENVLGLVATITVICTLAFGVMVANETYMSSYWEKRNLEKSQELAQLFEARTFVGSQGDTLLYRLLKPLDYDPKKKYPLVVSLHHGGDHGSDNIRQTGSQPAAILSTDENRRKYSAFHFVPQCPQGSVWGGNPYYPAIDSLVFEAIHALEQEFEIDEKRRYVGGISGGGFGSWHFIGTRPNMFAAAIPICGGGDTTLARNMVNVSVWAFHGEKDRLAPVSGSRDMIKAIKKAGGNPRYTEFPGAGHNIGNLVIETPGLLEWLFAQKRE